MTRYKDLWFAEFERHLNEMEVDDHELAARMADESATDLVADHYDRAYQEAKDRRAEQFANRDKPTPNED